MIVVTANNNFAEFLIVESENVSRPVTDDSSGGICYLQVLIKSPNGEVVPVQIPATLSTTTPVTVIAEVGDAVELTPSAMPGGSGKPAKSFSSSTASLSSSTSMGIASSTKQV